MTVATAKRKLKTARLKARDIRSEIDVLRQFILAAGENPDGIDLIPRNKAMYKRWRACGNAAQVAREFNLSHTTVWLICRRIKRKLEEKKLDYKKYHDLDKL